MRNRLLFVKNILFYVIAIITGALIAYGIASLVEIFLPSLKGWTFLIFILYWAYIGWKFPSILDKIKQGYFLNKIKGGRRGHGLAPVVGPYRLDMKIDNISGLTDMSAVEKDALRLNMEFKNARIFHAPHAEYADHTWEILLGTVEGKVYKVSALLELDNCNTRNITWQKMDGMLQSQLGAPETLDENMLAWDTKDGNVILNRSDANDLYYIVITLTSRAMSDFIRIR